MLILLLNKAAISSIPDSPRVVGRSEHLLQLSLIFLVFDQQFLIISHLGSP